MPVVISQHLLNVFVQLANKRELKKNLDYEHSFPSDAVAATFWHLGLYVVVLYIIHQTMA
jgi:hypothetical protein